MADDHLFGADTGYDASHIEVQEGLEPVRNAQQLGRDLDVSLEAILRRYIELHDEPLAAVWSKDGIIRSFARGRRFPYLQVRREAGLHHRSGAADFVRSGRPGRSRMLQADALAWLREADIELFEQTRVSRDGKHAVTLLWASASDGDAEDGEQDVDPGIDGRLRFR